MGLLQTPKTSPADGLLRLSPSKRPLPPVAATTRPETEAPPPPSAAVVISPLHAPAAPNPVLQAASPKSSLLPALGPSAPSLSRLPPIQGAARSPQQPVFGFSPVPPETPTI